MPVPMFDSPLTHMPRLGLGTWPMKGAECERAVGSALSMGYRHLDTAEMYGNEAEVGRALRASGVPRGEIYLTTKVWWDKPDAASFQAAAAACLERLGEAYADLLLVHWPSPDLRLEEVLTTLGRLRESGQARAVGVANFPLGLLRRAVETRIVPLACLQVEHHVYLGQNRLLAYTREQDMVLTSYTPLAKGRITEDPAIVRIATRLRATPGQVALAWLLAMPGVAAIPKAASAERQRENLAATELRLEPADLAALAALPKDRRLINPEFAPDWMA